MDIILPENVFDSRLESRCDSATNLFECLAPENMSDNGIQATLEDSDVSEQVDQLLSDMEIVANEKQSIEGNEDLLQSGTENESQCSDSPCTDNANEFVPTIIDIRGACDDSSKKLGNRATLPADSINTNSSIENNATCIIENDDDEDVHTINDNESSDCDRINSRSDIGFHGGVVIKQEPLDDDVDNDCMVVGSEGIGGCFTSEIEIKEERIHENYDNEVRCVETTSKIPLPIPIKIEANFESDYEIPTSQPQKLRKSSRQAEYNSSTSKSSIDKSSSKNASKLYSSSAYRCHLCNTTFEEHELLNEHMKLHRNNSLIERYNKSHGKQRTKSKYICRTCGKRLSTGQSLSQHMMIHNNEKPHVCPICKKDFRHLSNFKMHVQKHKEEEEQRRKLREKQKYTKKPPAPSTPPADRSVARSADFGRLVGPLFVKESLLKNSTPSSSSEISRPMITPKTEYRKPFELKYPKVAKHDSAKENLIYYKKMSSASRSHDEKYSRARKFNDDIGDDVIPLKTFNNVENIVMNATKFIVKVDNLDANLLKKKIKTPDISIDKSAASVHKLASDRKRRIQLSPSTEGAKCLKLDQIENIIMDAGETSSASIHDETEDNDVDDDLDLPTYYDDDDDTTVATPPPVEPDPSKQETLTTNELFELLNDDRDSKDAPAEQPSPKKSPKVDDTVSEALSPAPIPAVVKTPPKSSNVIVLKSTPSPVKSTVQSSPPAPLIIDEPVPVLKQVTPTKSPRVETPSRVAASPSNSIKSIDLTQDTPPKKEPENKPVVLAEENDADEDDIQADKCDMYDSAFRNVALRRLTLIRKKAAQNGGKVENRYLLGPLFWRKAVRKAQRNQLSREPAMSLSEAKSAFKRVNVMKFGKQDTRRTNDPTKLQQRAELKLQYILGRVKVTNDVSHFNLTGPLFWKRTLKLAGIHNPNDLRRLLVDDRLTINDVEFVTTKVAEPSVEVETTTLATSTSVTEMNGDVMIIDDEDSNSSVVDSNLGNAENINLNNNPVQMIARNTVDKIPSPILISLPEKSVKSPVALTGSDFLESIVTRNKTSQPITNGSHKSIVDGILNDDLLKPKIVEKPAPLLMTTPILTKVPPLSSVQVLKSTADSTKEPRRAATKAESILYDSLTKPRVAVDSPTSTATTTIPTPIIRSNQPFNSNSRIKPDTCSLLGTVAQPKPNPPIRRPANRSLLKSNSWATGMTKKSPRKAKQPSQPPSEPENRVVSLITSSTPTPAAPIAPAVAIVADTASHQIEVPDSTTALEAAGNIILNVDSADFQLIADSKNENGQETNYVLLSDGNGGVQLIKENDFRLLEDAGAASNASHYIVNTPGEENFANFDLINAAGANGEQLAYIQLDGENYTTLQFIQDAAAAGVSLEDPITDAAAVDVDEQKILGDKNVTIGGTNYVIAADPSADLNHIGKELSDFLHIDYGTLLKNDQQQT